MAIYSVGRKRMMLALLLTSVLLLTIDLRGNVVVDGARELFGRVLSPVQSATSVITNPLTRVWNGIVNFDDLERENIALQEQVDRLIGTQAAAQAMVIEGQELRALYSLPSLSGIDTVVAEVVGRSTNNIDQWIEINQGSRSGIEIGMAVVNQAGLVGKVTSVRLSSATVMLMTDPSYTVAATITSSAGAEACGVDATEPVTTTPSGMRPDELADAVTTTTVAPEPPGPTLPNGLPATDTGTTLPNGGFFGTDPVDPVTGEPLTAEQLQVLAETTGNTALAPPPDGAASDESVPDDTSGEPGSDTTTTTTIPPVVEKEYGALEGRGRRLLPQVRFVADAPSLAVLQVGDAVSTAGGPSSPAPTGIPIGCVVNRADRPGSAGPLLDIQPHADLGRLNYVRVVLYKPSSEAGD